MADNESNDVSKFELGDGIDDTTFGQILEMDEEDDEEREFSLSIVVGFFEQAQETFTKMDEALENEDLEELSKLGHFLKGSSATLGLVKVRDSCEKIQRFGKLEKEDGSPQPNESTCLNLITKTLQDVKDEYDEIEKSLKRFYKLDI